MGRIYWVVRGVPERHREKQRRKERSRERSREGKREAEKEREKQRRKERSREGKREAEKERERMRERKRPTIFVATVLERLDETGASHDHSSPFPGIAKTTEVGKDTSHCQLNIILQYLYYHISSINRPGPLIFSEAPHPGLLLEQGPLFFPHQFSGIPVIDIHNTTLLINNTSSSLVVSK